MSARSVCWCVSMLIAACVGCSSSDVTRYDVSGTVTFDGQPVPSGSITFQPATGNEGPGGIANIKDGKYDTAKEGKGPTGGPHHVTISGYDGNADPGNELPLGRPLFDAYRTEVDLPKAPAPMTLRSPHRPSPNRGPSARISRRSRAGVSDGVSELHPVTQLASGGRTPVAKSWLAA